MKKILAVILASALLIPAAYGAVSSPQKGTMSLNLELTDPGGTDTVTDTITLKYISASEIEPFIRARLSNYGAVQVNDALNMIIITDKQNKVIDLINVARKLDVKGLKNFMKAETVVIPVKNVQAGAVSWLIAERLGPGSIIKVDENQNALIITDVKSKIDQARELLALLDVAPRQVMIEAKIVEFHNDKDSQFGVDWRTILQSVQASAGVAAAGTFLPAGDVLSQAVFSGAATGASAGMSGVDTILGILEKEGKAQVIASPRIVASNNRMGYINTGDQIYYDVENAYMQVNGGVQASGNAQQQYYSGTTFTTVSGQVNNSTNNGFGRNNYKGTINTGVDLRVIPHVISGELVTLDIVANINNLTGWSPQGHPVVSNRSANSTITIKSGEVFVMGGLKKEMMVKTMDRVPFLGYIPLLGLLFSSEKETKVSTDVVIFIAPVILAETGKNNPEADNKIFEKSKEGIK